MKAILLTVCLFVITPLAGAQSSGSEADPIISEQWGLNEMTPEDLAFTEESVSEPPRAVSVEADLQDYRLKGKRQPASELPENFDELLESETDQAPLPDEFNRGPSLKELIQ